MEYRQNYTINGNKILKISEEYFEAAEDKGSEINKYLCSTGFQLLAE